ncbi:MAG: DUF368 domain-containing protein [Deltaproteobacteria bacterium]|nr:DUF368 domain-containing protein [Deltaproteobacteria bacterium]
MTYKEAFLAGPGPRTWREALILWAKGFAMGSADIIPGVSGGTIAFITGIYSQLITAITSFDLVFFRRLLQGDLKGALAETHLKFLAPLFLGIALALLSMARLMNYLLAQHPVPTWSLFFGLIAASILAVSRQLERRSALNLVIVAVFAVLAWLIVGLIPVETPRELWFIFLSGVVAICAMILPGISGAFILLILGKYEYVTATLKNPFDLGNLVIIIVFVAGAALGITTFSRVLKWLFARFPNGTVAALTGFMLGAMRKVWPWKEVVESKVVNGKLLVLAEHNVWPSAVDASLFLALGLMAVGFVTVWLLERWSLSRQAPAPAPAAPREA